MGKPELQKAFNSTNPTPSRWNRKVPIYDDDEKKSASLAHSTHNKMQGTIGQFHLSI